MSSSEPIISKLIPSTREFLRFAAPISAGSIFDFTTMVVAILLISHRSTEETAVLAMTNTLVNFGFFFIYDAAEVVGLRCTAPYALKRFEEFTVNFCKSALALGVVFFWGAAFMLSSGSILRGCGLDAEVADSVHRLALAMIPLKMVEAVNVLMKGGLYAQKQSDFSLPMTLVSVVSAEAMMVVLIWGAGLGPAGFILSMLCKHLGEILYMSGIYRQRSSREIFFVPKISQIISDFWRNFKFVLIINSSKLGEIFAYEFNLFIAASTNDLHTIVCWQYYGNIIILFLLVVYGFASGYRTYAKIILAKGNLATLQAFLRKALRTFLACFLGLSVLLFLAAGAIARVYTAGPDAATLTRMIRANFLEVVFASGYIFFSAIHRVAGMEKYPLWVSILPGPLTSVFVSVCLVKVFAFGALGLAFALSMSDLVCFGSLAAIYRYKAEESLPGVMKNAALDEEFLEDVELSVGK